MARNGAATRTAIMDAAESLILKRGFAATSVDEVIAATGATKGTFFYHFKSKAALAQALVERYARLDAEHLERTLARAEALSRDPLQQVLILVGLLKEEAAVLTEPSPGCLYASYLYEAQLFDAQVHGIIEQSMRLWRERLGGKLAAAIDRSPPRLPVAAESLAEMLIVIFEGSFVLSKVLKDPKVVAEQLGHYRNYLELLFAPDGGRAT